MSDLSKELEKLARDLELENLQLSERDRAAFAIEKHKAETMRRELEARERDEASYPERCRAQRHHDVLCLVLKAHVEDQLRNDGQGPLTKGGLGLAVEMSRYAADLAYPPPKAEEP